MQYTSYLLLTKLADNFVGKQKILIDLKYLDYELHRR